MSATKYLKWTVQTQNDIFWKIVCLEIWYQKIKYTEEIFSLKKIHCFSKVLTTFYKFISKINCTIFIKKRFKYEDKKDATYLLKKLKSFNATWQLWTAHLATKKNVLFGIRRKQISFFDPIFRNIFFVIVIVIIMRDLKNFSAELRDLQLRGCFYLVMCLSLSLLFFFIVVYWKKFSQLLPFSIISEIFFKALTPK